MFDTALNIPSPQFFGRPKRVFAVLEGLSPSTRKALSDALHDVAEVTVIEHGSVAKDAPGQAVVYFVDITNERYVQQFRHRKQGVGIAVLPPEFKNLEKVFEDGFADYIRIPFIPAVIMRRIGALGLHSNIPETPDAFVQRACAILEDGICHTITLDDLARKLGTNRTTLNTKFKETFGFGPMTWLRRKRCDEAARFLKTSSQSVLQIALAVGYSDANNFSTAFRKIYGCSPLNFRKNCKNQRNHFQTQRIASMQPDNVQMWT